MRLSNKRFLKFSKRYISKESYSKLKNIREGNELDHTIKAALRTAIESEYYAIRDIIDENEENKDLFIAKTKFLTLPGKIKLVMVDYDPDEIKKLFNLMSLIKEEIKHV